MGFFHIAQFVMENNLEIINLARKQFRYFSFYRYVACNTEEPSFDTLSTSVCCLLIPSPITSAICLELQISFGTDKEEKEGKTLKSKYQHIKIIISILKDIRKF